MAQDPVEVEVKLRVGDPIAARSRIESAGFGVHKPRALERNVILDTADLRHRKRGELLRIRQVDGRGVITYKGPTQQGRHKIREELESDISNPAMVEALFSRIGFGPVFRYEKYRTEYKRESDSGVVTLDETPIGPFIELEGPADWIDNASRELGFTESEYVLSSYANLYLEYCAQHGLPPGDMAF